MLWKLAAFMLVWVATAWVVMELHLGLTSVLLAMLSAARRGDRMRAVWWYADIDGASHGTVGLIEMGLPIPKRHLMVTNRRLMVCRWMWIREADVALGDITSVRHFPFHTYFQDAVVTISAREDGGREREVAVLNGGRKGARALAKKLEGLGLPVEWMPAPQPDGSMVANKLKPNR